MDLRKTHAIFSFLPSSVYTSMFLGQEWVIWDSMDHLKEIVTWKIRRLENVKATLTIIVGECK